ncbi:ParA family protein [Levilactobacillus brevis]
MTQSNLEKQEAKLKALNQKIKDEKNKIEQRLGKQIISQSNLDYANLSNDQIKLLAFDYIIIDVPPTLSIFTNNAILASDYISLVLQTQKQAYTSVLKTAQYMFQLKSDYRASFNVAGVILYLVKKDAKVDKEITQAAIAQYTQDDPHLQHDFKLYQTGMSDIDVDRNTGIKRTTFIRYRKKLNIKR